MVMAEVRSIWSTPGGGQGFSVWHFLNVQSAANAQVLADLTSSWFNGIKAILPNEVTVVSAPEVRGLNEITGDLEVVYGVTPAAPIVGTSVAVYNRAAGARIDFNTNAIVGGRRLKGRKYIVPIDATAFDASGLLIQSVVNTITNATTALYTATQTAGMPMAVWSRKHGAAVPVGSYSVPRQGAILRGRRD